MSICAGQLNLCDCPDINGAAGVTELAKTSEDQISLLGQFDAGLSMQVSRRLRAQVGYRLMGISGVSLAGDQVPYNLGHAYDLENSDVNGSLLLHGMYYGGEFCF